MKGFTAGELFSPHSDAQFRELALSLFRRQYAGNEVYKNFADALNTDVDAVSELSQIPFLPIELFKSRDVICGPQSEQAVVFTSSSTTSAVPSRHIVSDISIYEASFTKGFELFYGDPSEFVIIALLPGYIERGGSSLVYMADKLLRLSGQPESGFYLNNYSELAVQLERLKRDKRRVLLIGVSYALLDLLETGIKLSDNFIVMETGGMKGRRREMLKEELHGVLKEGFGVSRIHSEYGMTELLSQAYSKGEGIYRCPPWMKVMARDINDPLSYVAGSSTGGLNIIDLANIHSCAFIATQDLGRLRPDGSFELMGRFDNSDIRGCNLMVG